MVFSRGKPLGKLKKVVRLYHKALYQGKCDENVVFFMIWHAMKIKTNKKCAGKASDKTIASLLCQGFFQGFAHKRDSTKVLLGFCLQSVYGFVLIFIAG